MSPLDNHIVLTVTNPNQNICECFTKEYTSRSIRMKTLQQIYDFCKLDATFNEYYNIPDHFNCKDRKTYLYYYGDIDKKGHSRAGTFIFYQSQLQLFRFLGIKPDWCADSIRFFLDPEKYEIVNREDYRYPGVLIYVRCTINGKGARIEFTHPFAGNDDIIYCGRSHQQYTEQGIRKDVINYIQKHILFPAGRYRDLQLEHQILKKDFIGWYKNTYLPDIEEKNKSNHLDMLDRYTPVEPEVSWDDCYGALASMSVFYDMGCDNDMDRYDLTDQFYEMCNR